MNTVFVEDGETTVNVDDILETVNHFSCFDYMLNIADKPLSEEQIKKFHHRLKINTTDSKKTWFKVGDYKTKPNVVGGIETSLPADVSSDMENLLKLYHQKETVTFEDIVNFHFQFERIHP